MKKEILRPRSLAADELDAAVAEALTRVGQARVLSARETEAVAGGDAAGPYIEDTYPQDPWTTTDPWIIDPWTTWGMYPSDPWGGGDWDNFGGWY